MQRKTKVGILLQATGVLSPAFLWWIPSGYIRGIIAGMLMGVGWAFLFLLPDEQPSPV
jgi:hypothetical protein